MRNSDNEKDNLHGIWDFAGHCQGRRFRSVRSKFRNETNHSLTAAGANDPAKQTWLDYVLPMLSVIKRAKLVHSAAERRRPSLLRRHSTSSSVCAHSRCMR